MSKLSTNYKLLSLALAGWVLSGCGEDFKDVSCGENEAQTSDGASCVVIPEPPPLVCAAPLVPNADGDACEAPVVVGAPDPVRIAAANEAVLYYNRPDGQYDGWVLHLWNDAPCPDSVVNVTEWPAGEGVEGIDPNYGGYFVIPLLDGYSSCMNFIVHDADGNKDLSDQDLQLNLTGERMAWTLSGVQDVFEQPLIGSEGIALDGAGLHWVTANEFIWDQDLSNVAQVRLYFSADGDMTYVPGSSVGDEEFIELTAGATLSAEASIAPTQTGWDVLSSSMEMADVKSMLKNQLIAVAYDANDAVVAATRVQMAKALDNVYTSGDNDADEATLGLTYSDTGITAAVWAPTAQSVGLQVFNAAKELQTTVAMTEDTATGVWSTTVDNANDRMFYRYELSVYHPVSAALVTLESTDPYSVSVATNGRYSQMVNLDDDDTKPDGWDSHTIPTVAYPEDSVIYEGHVRDFSVRDESVSVANRGKYMAFTETDAAPMKHLQTLQEAGLTHFHILPANDIASVDEDESTRVNLTDTVGDLCAVRTDAPVCGVADDAATLLSVLEGYDPASDDAQALVSSMRGLDSFNWGYDPHHFNAPEGSYATDPDGIARIKEMRAMNQALHSIGLRVIMDNVYNHTNASGVGINSVLDKTVPGYYHRYNQTSGNIERSTCCDNTATENRMMAKFIEDSMVVWAQQYKFDGFRFDLMGHLTKESVLAARTAVEAIDPDTYFYGEGWDFGEVAGDRLFEQARQDNMAGTEIGTFNDRIREAVRGGALFNNNSDEGTLNVMDTLKVTMAGTLADYNFVDRSDRDSVGATVNAYAEDPADIINYVSVHDNETLWDQFQYALPADISLENRVRAHNVALAIPMLSQGIPFFHMGADLLRSKSMDRNSFDSGDWFNYIDFTKQTNNWDVGIPLHGENGAQLDNIRALQGEATRAPGATDIEFATSVFQEFMQIRGSSRLFRLTTGDDINARVGFHTVGASQTGGVIVMSIDDGTGLTDLDPMHDAAVVMVNGTSSEQSVTVATAAGFTLHPMQVDSADSAVTAAEFTAGTDEGTFTIPAYSVAVFVKEQGDAQGAGLSAFATSGEPDLSPFVVPVFLRGVNADWDATTEFSYDGDNLYSVAVVLEADVEQSFKIADADYSAVNFGAADADSATVDEGVAELLVATNDNLSFTPTVAGTFIFTVDATDTAAPTLTITNEEPFAGNTVYVRGSMNEWAATDAMTYDGQGIYFFEMDVMGAGDVTFKLADAEYTDVNFGSNGTAASVGDYIALESPGNDIVVNIAAAGSYVFTLDASDLSAPTVSVFEAGMYGDTDLYIRGNFNAWGAEAGEEMTFDGSFTYSKELDLTAGDLIFKVADATWDIANKGAGADVSILQLDTRLRLETTPTGGDITLSIPENGIYVFELKGPDTENPSVRVSAKGE
jgi:pullulanase